MRKNFRIGEIRSICSNIRKYRTFKSLNKHDQDVHALIQRHFEFWSTDSHENRPAFEIALETLKGKPANIVETGTSAWGTDSTRIWDGYIRKFGGTLYSVDIRGAASRALLLQTCKNTQLVIGDSVIFLAENPKPDTDLYYLDSWDLDFSNPIPSALHGMMEFMSIKDQLKSGSLLFVDDTPSELVYRERNLGNDDFSFERLFDCVPGKGALIKKYLDTNISHEVLHHGWSYLVRIS